MGVHPQPKRRRLLVSQPEDFRNNLRSTTWCQKFRVWGQPCAWADAVIAQWTLRYIKEFFNQAFVLADCLHAHWNEDSLAVAWALQLVQLAIAPGATALLQVADTHYHAPFKVASVRGGPGGWPGKNFNNGPGLITGAGQIMRGPPMMA